MKVLEPKLTGGYQMRSLLSSMSRLKQVTDVIFVRGSYYIIIEAFYNRISRVEAKIRPITSTFLWL